MSRTKRYTHGDYRMTMARAIALVTEEYRRSYPDAPEPEAVAHVWAVYRLPDEQLPAGVQRVTDDGDALSAAHFVVLRADPARAARLAPTAPPAYPAAPPAYGEALRPVTADGEDYADEREPVRFVIVIDDEDRESRPRHPWQLNVHREGGPRGALTLASGMQDIIGNDIPAMLRELAHQWEQATPA
jgi:hypothetical protein